MRVALASLAVAVCSACGTGGTNCRAVEDAGSSVRAFGEPCGDGVVACDTGLSCELVRSSNAQSQCVRACGGDAGTCGPNRGCLNGLCVPTCMAAGDCPGRFAGRCEPTDAGVGLCIAVGCSASDPCPSGGRCVTTTPWCCPVGAPCAAPPPGVCLR